MSLFRRTAVLAAALAAVTSLPAPAQQAGLAGDLLADLKEVEEKLVGLAKAIPADKYQWRPAEGVRSVGEVMMHVAADNYLMPGGVGMQPPASTGIKVADYKTVQAYENRKASRDEIIADLEVSFAHLRKALEGTTAARMGESVTFFGQQMTVQKLWILTVTHLHEHLGQGIAYARSNGVKPPWSR
ncbi:MAG TPA: DinB family protein [Gemmatimonadales bacterium]